METDSKLYEELCKSSKIPLDDKVVATVSTSSSTGELCLIGTSLTTQTCEVIGKLLLQSKVITKLDFSDCLLPQQGLVSVLNTIPSSKIHSLQLKGNNINASSTIVLARMISKSSQVKMLGLEWNNIGICSEAMEQFFNALARNSCIEVLDLRNNQFDADCALHLGNALKKNITLRALDVRWNSIEEEGAQYLLSAMQVNKTLTSLKITGNSVPNDLATALDLATKHNLSLHQLRSECDARTQLLARHVRVMSEQRAQELKQWTEKSQRNLRETEGRLQELEMMLCTKQSRIEALEREKSVVDEVKVRLKEMEAELKEKDQLCQEARKERERLNRTVDKIKYDHEADITNLQTSLNRERTGETQRADEAEQRLNRALKEITSLKDELEVTQARHASDLEVERKLLKEQLQRAEKNFETRLSDAAYEASRTEQAMKDKVALLESAVETLERNKCELNAQLLNERTRWKEEKSVVLCEAKEREEYKFLLLNEKLEHLKEDKLALEGQVAIGNSTMAELRRDNAALVAQLGDMNRKLSHSQEDISSERLVSQCLRLEKIEDTRQLEASRGECDKLRIELSCLEKKMSDTIELHEKIVQNEKKEKERIQKKLESKENEIFAIRTEETERIGLLFTAFNKYCGRLQKT